jgi:GTP pyrophosphokinase
MTEVAKFSLGDLSKSLPKVQMNVSDRERLEKAVRFATEKFGELRRPAGGTYLEHGYNVVAVLAEIGVDDTVTTIAALLHDVLIPETGVTEGALAKEFGREITSLIKGAKTLDEYAKRASSSKLLSELTIEAKNDQKTIEAIRKALLSIIEGDIRIIVIRMVDCLQDLRRVGKLKKEDRLRLAYEAMHIYAPLANRLGIWHLKWQLEDLAFRFLEPEKYRHISRQLDEKREMRAAKVKLAATRLRETVRAMSMNAEVTGRSKHIYSIYRKMARKRLNFEQINDIQALRVIIEPVDRPEYDKLTAKAKDEVDRALCYQVLGAVHSLWQPLKNEFDDYISSPKANGYKSLHTAVLDTETGQRFEVQIRTQRMHEEAERGIAAHWAYKEQTDRVSSSDKRQVQNLRELLAALQEAEEDPNALASVDVNKIEERIHVFTPNDDVVDLPAGSTPIDFAYQIHTEVGHRCHGARVDGKMVSLDYRLKSGEKVEILTGKRGNPNRDWMNPSLGYTASARTRSKIRQWFRQQEREKNIQQGREVIERELKRLALLDVYSIEDIAHALKYEDINDFLAKVGFGDIQTVQITGAIALMQHALKPNDEELLPLLNAPSTTPKKKGLMVRGVSGLHTRIAKCCHPISPEPIIGYITRGEGVTIHRRDCKQVLAIKDRERLIEVSWGIEAETYPIPIVVTSYRRGGLIEDLVNTLRGQQINVSRTKLVTTSTTMIAYMIVEVADLTQLTWLLNKLATLPNVIEARRQQWT